MTGFFDLPGWAITLARRVLYLWVRTTVFPEKPQELGLDPSKPVCYALQDHGLANQLVLFQESRLAGLPSAENSLQLNSDHFPHSVFFLNPKHTPNVTARERYAHSPMMTALICEALANKALEVQIVPVVILWGRSPDKQNSFLKALFSENWERPAPLRRLLTILLHGRNVLVRFNPPISLHAFSNEGLDQAKALRKLSRVLRVHFRRQRQMVIGPDLSHRNTQVETLLSSPPVRAAIAAEASAHEVSLPEAHRRARCFALEIASDYSYSTLRAFKLCLSWLWPRLYDGIEIHNIDLLARILPDQEVIYVPAHRSHIDYLLLSYILYSNGFTPPHIAAGANLNIPIIGSLLRRCGAFFLRRSFKGDPLYSAVFDEYLHLMLSRGFPLEYFIEGGRSRNGRTLLPKAGILGMTIRSFIREHARPLVFVPVYIGYEKLIEGRTYLREMAGKPKQRESLWALLKTVRQIKRVFGRVHINFGEPLSLADFLDTQRPTWAKDDAIESSDWPRDATLSAATELARRINAAAVINPVNLIALALLPTQKFALDELMLDRVLAHLQMLATKVPYAPSTISCASQPRQIVDYAERLGFAERVSHPMGNLVRIPQDKAPLLMYFRNNVLHLFALPALIACLVSHNRELSLQRLREALSGVYRLLQTELFLHWTEEELLTQTDAIISVLEERRLLHLNEAELLAAPEQNSQEFAELQLIGEILYPLLVRHFLLLAVLQHEGSGNRTRQTLENDCYLLAERFALLYEFNSQEYSDKKEFSSLITHLIEADLLIEDETGLLHYDQRTVQPLAHAELVLPAETRQAIRRMACRD